MDPITEPIPPAETKTPEPSIADIIRGKAALHVTNKDGVKVVSHATQTPAKEVKKEEAAPVVEEPPKVDPPAEEKKEEPKQPDPADKSPAANFARLRQERDKIAAEKAEFERQLAEIRAEHEKLKSAPVPEDFKAKLTETEKALEEYRRELRASSLERDPEFRRTYDEGIRAKATEMQDIAIRSGIPKEEIAAAMANWDEEKFSEFADAMPRPQRIRFEDAWGEALKLERQRLIDIKDADKLYEERQRQQQQAFQSQQEQYRAQISSDVDATFAELSAQELLKDDPALIAETKTLLRKASGLDGEALPRREVMKILGSTFATAKAFKAQHERMEVMKAEMAEKDKKIGELEAFVKAQGDATPRVGASASVVKSEKSTPIWQGIRVGT